MWHFLTTQPCGLRSQWWYEKNSFPKEASFKFFHFCLWAASVVSIVLSLVYRNHYKEDSLSAFFLGTLRLKGQKWLTLSGLRIIGELGALNSKSDIWPGQTPFSWANKKRKSGSQEHLGKKLWRNPKWRVHRSEQLQRKKVKVGRQKSGEILKARKATSVWISLWGAWLSHLFNK